MNLRYYKIGYSDYIKLTNNIIKNASDRKFYGSS